MAHPAPGRVAFGLEWEAFLSEQAVAGCSDLEIDLAGVPSMGSVGLSVLVGVRYWALQRGIAMRVRGAQPSVWRVFEATGQDQVFTGAEESPAAPMQELALF